MRMHKLKVLSIAVLAAPPFLLALTGCSFDGAPLPVHWDPGPPSRHAAIFVSVERGRDCVGPEWDPMGIDLPKWNEALLGGKSSMYGLDYSPAAKARCNGRPERVLYQGPFPEGNAVCLNPDRIGSGNDGRGRPRYPDVTAAAISWCEEHVSGSWGPWIDGDGNRYYCPYITGAAPGLNVPIPNACTDSGILRPDFQDPRKLPLLKPVTWTNVVNLAVQGTNRNSLRKTVGGDAYDAGAATANVLGAGGFGALEVTVIEADRERTIGFAPGGLPDGDPSNADIDFGVVLQANGQLVVRELGQNKISRPYRPGDKVRLMVLGGLVHYFQNGDLFYASGTQVGNVPLRVSASLRSPNGTIADAFTTF